MSLSRAGMFGPYLGSLVLHAVIIVLFGVGWVTWKRTAPVPALPPQLAIEALVVDPRSLAATTLRTPTPPAKPKLTPAPPPPPSPPPSQAPEEVTEARRREVVAKQVAEAARVAEDRLREEAKAEAKRVAEKLAAENLAEEKRQRAESEKELQRSLATEERERIARASGAAAQWQALIRAKIEGAWLRPPTARPGLDCVVQVRQVPGGEVVAVSIKSCNGDDAVRQSIENAVYRASPLPPPPDAVLFERNLELRFRPSE